MLQGKAVQHTVGVAFDLGGHDDGILVRSYLCGTNLGSYNCGTLVFVPFSVWHCMQCVTYYRAHYSAKTRAKAAARCLRINVNGRSSIAIDIRVAQVGANAARRAAAT